MCIGQAALGEHARSWRRYVNREAATLRCIQWSFTLRLFESHLELFKRNEGGIHVSLLPLLILLQLSDSRLEPARRLDEQRVAADGRRRQRAELALQQRGQRRHATAAVDLLAKEERDCQRTPEGRLVDCHIGRRTRTHRT